MMLNDDFDEKLFNYFENNIEVPEKIKNGIWEVNLKNDNKIINIFNIKKVANSCNVFSYCFIRSSLCKRYFPKNI